MLDNNTKTILANAMASEHTSYKSTKQYLKQLPITGDRVIQGPGENAGIVDLGGDYALAVRIESHNHPSFISPYNGAATGVGGILRDIFTMGARPIGLIDILRFGSSEHSNWLRQEVVRGIADYGNTIGVPVIGGDVSIDDTYNHNCLVNVAALGLVKKSAIIYGNALTADSDLIYVGGKTGMDGVGGAEMASSALDTHDEEKIQKPDPYLEKLLLEACCELATTDWVEGMQDMGAAGLLCSTTEVVLRGRAKTGKKLGSIVFLDKIPTKVDMSPTDILLSESQERMLVVGKSNRRQQILDLFKHWDLEAHVIGRITEDDAYELNHNNQNISMKFEEIIPDIEENWTQLEWKIQYSNQEKLDDLSAKEIWQQYDWMVGTRTLKGPNKKGKYAILDLPEIGKELIVSWSSDSGISNFDPVRGINFAICKCISNIRLHGGHPIGLTNCLNFGHPKDSIGAFAQTIEGMANCCRTQDIPVVSGNVSLYNSHDDLSIKPSPVIVMVGIRE